VRKQLEPRLPVIQIPVKIEQGVDLPTVSDGPVRLQGARMALSVEVAGVFAGQGVLWVAVRVVPGDLTREASSPAPAASPSARPSPNASPGPSATPAPSPKVSPSGESH
jgi:hypothetical protein